MRQIKRWLWIGAPTLLASCALQTDDPKTSKTDKIAQPLNLTAGTHIDVEGILDVRNSVVFGENPTTQLEAKDFHGFEFDGQAGGIVTLTATTTNSTTCGNLDTILDLFGPEDANGNRGTSLVENDDAFLSGHCFLDSQIKSFKLPVTGTYLLAVTSFLQEGANNEHYRLQVQCNNNACQPAGTVTFGSTRISQADIDRGVFTPEDLFGIGDANFENTFQLTDGLGNALIGTPAGNSPRPNFRQFPNNVHFAAFGAPEAQNCVTCHNVGGDDGAGDNNHNIFQIGDGVNRASGVPRNPPTVLGNGLRQRIGEEMTSDLKGILAAAKTQNASSHAAVTKSLVSKGINFGSITVNADATVNTAAVVGVDADLVVKPFGWKGREATLRRFIEGGFRVHFGMQTQPSIDGHCRTPNVNTFGTGADCQDPDADGVKEEVTEGQLTAEAIYMGLRETPVRVPAVNAAAQTRANAGETLFNQVGCNSCHTQNVSMKSPIHFEASDTTGAGKGISINLAVDNHEPRPAQAADGSLTIEVYSDFKRHDMGTGLADVKNFNQIAANQFITVPLWGVADSAPYLHDGRAPTLKDAILAHGGEAQTVRNNFAALSADNQSKLVEFLSTLGRIEDVGRAKVDLSNFDLSQTGASIDFFVPAGTLVPHNGFLVVARNATKTAFQNFYGKTLGSNVVFINAAATGQSFPQINGGETYSLFDSQFVPVDGPTVQEPAGGLRTFSRLRCQTASALAASWASQASSVAVATPGAGVLSTNLNKVCISEIADVGGGASTGFEFLEVFVE